jgi:hypothetical protein
MNIKSKYTVEEEIAKQDKLFHFTEFTVCRGIEKGPEFSNTYKIEPRWNSHYLYIIDGGGVEETTGTIFEKGSFYNVKSLFTTTRKFLIPSGVKWVAFSPVDVAREYRAEIIRESKLLSNCYVIPVDGTVVVNNTVHEFDEYISIDSNSNVELGTSTALMIVYK